MTARSAEEPRGGRKQRLLLRVERFSREHWGAVFLATLLAVAGALWLGSKLRLESDVLALLPKENREVSAFRKALRDFGAIDYLIVLHDVPPGTDPEVLEGFADELAARLLDEHDLVDDVQYRLQPDADFLALFYENALLFLPPEKLPELAAKLDDRAVRDRLQAARAMLSTPAGGVAEMFLRNDPLGLMPLFLNRVLGGRGAFEVDLSDGYYLSKDNRSLLMLVRPTRPSQDLEFSRALLERVRALESEVRQEFAADGDAADVVAVRYGGNYAMVLEETALIRADVRRNLWVSLLAVSALFWLCYRRFAALLYSSIPLLVGQALTAGVAFLALRQLNAASSAFTALLMGLGTDFTIVMYARYVEERHRGKGIAEASEAMVGQTGLGVFTGAVTSAGTFFAMCISEFRGLFDLGFLIGVGIVLCAVAIVFLMPAMITWNETVRPRRIDPVRKLHLQSFGLEHLMPWAARHRAWTLAAVGTATAAGAVLAFGLEFDDSINALRSNRTEAARVQQDIAETFGASLSYMMAIVEAPDTATAVSKTAELHDRLLPFVADGTIGSYDSILSYLPPEEQQRAVLQALAADHSGAFDAARIRATFVAALEEHGFRGDAFDDTLARLDRFLSPSRPIGVDDLERRGLSRLVDRYVRADSEGVRVVTYLFPTDPRWKRRPPPGLIDALVAADPAIVVTGTNVVGQELRGFFSREAPRAVAVGLVLVFVLLLADFRSLRLTTVALAQLVCGVIMMLGGMRLAGISLNYVNAFVAVMILGVGIDYSIHLVHRMDESTGAVDAGLLETGKAVVMAALLNIAGFGTLMLGHYPALRSFGFVAAIGSVTCLLTALTLVPALMARPHTRDGS